MFRYGSLAVLLSVGIDARVALDFLVPPAEREFHDIGPAYKAEYFDIGPYQVSERPKVWVFDDLLSRAVLNAVNESFAEKNTDGCWEAPSEANQIMDTLQSLAHITHPMVYQDKMYVAEYEPGHQQHPHMDRYSIANYPDELLATVNVSRLHKVADEKGVQTEDQAIPLFSFVVNFGDVGSCRFLNPLQEIPAKEGRIVMWQNYHDDGTLDKSALHHGTYPTIGVGKRILAAGAVADPTNPPNLRSTTPQRGWLHFPLENHSGNGGFAKRLISMLIRENSE